MTYITEGLHMMQRQENTTKKYGKKALVAALAGAFLATGIFAAQLAPVAYGAEAERDSAQYRLAGPRFERTWSADEEAQRIADEFGLDRQQLLDYNTQGWHFRDLHRAAFIAYAGQKPLSDVLNAKTASNRWYDVERALGVTPEQCDDARDRLFSRYLASGLQANEKDIQSFLKDGYHPRDIAIAYTLAEKAGKSAKSVLGMKKINNYWSDVAEALGISEADYRQSRFDADHCFGGGPRGGFGHYGGPRGYHHR